jgi:hypothetical protein
MNFEEFQNQSRLYVIGALEPAELEEFERERKKSGKRAEDFITQCYVLHETFALSLRPEKASASIKERLTQIMRKRSRTLQPKKSLNIARRGHLRSRFFGNPFTDRKNVTH